MAGKEEGAIPDYADADEAPLAVEPQAEEMKAAVQQFRDTLLTHEEALAALPPSSATPDHDTVARFLRARKMKVDKAVRQYLDAEAWFQAEGVEGITEADPNEPVYAAMCPHRSHGYDKKGRPLYIEHTGRMRVGKMLQFLDQDDLVRRHIRQQEIARCRMRKRSAKLGRTVDQQVVIMDMANLSMAPDMRGIAVFKRCLKIDQVRSPSPLAGFPRAPLLEGGALLLPHALL